MYCLPLEGKRRPTKHVDFGAQSLSALFPNCLHLRNIVTFVSPKLATSDAATSYWMRFPLINLYTLLSVRRVETSITGCNPHRSVRAQLRHTALHDTNTSNYPYMLTYILGLTMGFLFRNSLNPSHV